MDLREMRHEAPRRHPWETARVQAIARVLDASLHDGIRVLDVGCGDGYVCRALFRDFPEKRITAVDINLTAEQIEQMQDPANGITYLAQLPSRGCRFDLTLLLDVVEHVGEDRQFLADIVEHHVAGGGRVIITVPAFGWLYSSHDLYLKHHRRYRLESLEALAASAGLRIAASGYLFGCLLIPKLLHYKILDCQKRCGVGCWDAGPAVTAVVEGLFRLENHLMIRAARAGVKLPGLTAWALCEKPA